MRLTLYRVTTRGGVAFAYAANALDALAMIPGSLVCKRVRQPAVMVAK